MKFLKEEFNLVQVIKLGIMLIFLGSACFIALKIISLLEAILNKL